MNRKRFKVEFIDFFSFGILIDRFMYDIRISVNIYNILITIGIGREN